MTADAERMVERVARDRALARAAGLIEEFVDLYDRAREAQQEHLPTVVGAPFEERVRMVAAELEALGIASEYPKLAALNPQNGT